MKKIKNLKISQKRIRREERFTLSDGLMALGVKPIDVNLLNKSSHIPMVKENPNKKINPYTKGKVLVKRK